METINIEGFNPVYKVLPPFMKFDGGFGYKGVLLEDKETGKLQCHLCGTLANNLSKHLYHKHKGVSANDYREKVGLNKYVPLMSEQTRKKIKNNFLNLTDSKRKEVIKRLKENNKNAHESGNWKKREKTGSIQYQNKYGTCPEQAKTQFFKEYKELGRIPTNDEMSGRLRSLVYTRFSSYKEALISWGISEQEYREHFLQGKINSFEARRDQDFFPKYDKDDVKKLYSDFFFEKKRFPTWGEVKQFGLPSRVVFERAFGGTKSNIESSFKVKEQSYA